MYSFGIYDSGIGGLTTLCALKKVFPFSDFFYFADTANSPLGTKKYSDIVAVVNDAVDLLKRKSRVQVIACNTASTVVKPKNTFHLRPDLEKLVAERTLLLCTPATEKALKLGDKGFAIADTKNLATAVEILGETAFKANDFSLFSNLEGYLKKIIDEAMAEKDIDTIYLGCSHYLFFKGIIEKLYPEMKIVDGNNRLIDEIIKSSLNAKGNRKITFDFSLGNQSKKYGWLLARLEERLDFQAI